MKTKTVLSVDGMTCKHCVNRVTESLMKLTGVSKVSANLKKKAVKVEYDGSVADADEIKKIILGLGYIVI